MLSLLFFCLATLSPFLWADTSQSLQWFSDKPREMAPLLADPAEAQMKVGYLFKGDDKSYLEMGLGGQLGVVRADLEEGALAFQVRGQILSRFEFFSHSFDLQDTDFTGGLSTSYRHGTTVYEILTGHRSSHLGDDIQSRGLRSPINFSYEFVRFLSSFKIFDGIRLYGGAQTNVRSDPATIRWRPIFILGGDVRPFTNLPDFFTALDLRFMGPHEYSPNLSLAIGYELGNASQSRRQRIQLEVFNGYSNLGQFDQTREFYFFLGFAFAM